MPALPQFSFSPVTASTWPLLEDLFGPDRGADSGCWCMWWLVSRSDFNAMGKSRRKAALRELCDNGEPLGLPPARAPKAPKFIRQPASRAVVRPCRLAPFGFTLLNFSTPRLDITLFLCLSVPNATFMCLVTRRCEVRWRARNVWSTLSGGVRCKRWKR